MDFKTAMEHYRQGCADAAETALVEEELEKARLISEYLDQGWELEETPAEDMKPVKRRLRRRNAGIILTSLVLAAALLWGTVSFALPALEKTYWDPRSSSFQDWRTDLELMFSAYAELFCPDYSVFDVRADRVGFASYGIGMTYWDTARGGDPLYQTCTLEKGELKLPANFWNYVPVNIFLDPKDPVYAMEAEHVQQTRERLSILPEYIRVRAAISFPEDKSMEELITFRDALPEGYLDWVGIRTTSDVQQATMLCGMNPFSGGVLRDAVNDVYPYFDVKLDDNNPEALEQHFATLLRFSQDQYNAGTGIQTVNFAGDSFYQETLDYVGENGVYTYGGYLTASPETFLELLDSGAVSQVWIEDVWIG